MSSTTPFLTSSSSTTQPTTSSNKSNQKYANGSKDTNAQQSSSASLQPHNQNPYRTQFTTQSAQSSPIQPRHKPIDQYPSNLNVYKSKLSSELTKKNLSSSALTSPSLTIKINNNINNTTYGDLSPNNTLNIPLTTKKTIANSQFVPSSANNLKYNSLPPNSRLHTSIDRSNNLFKASDNKQSKISSEADKRQIKRMKIIPSPTIRIADLFRCFLKNVPKNTETIESIVHYGDNIGAKSVKCIINESTYEAQTLLKTDYDIYQGPALCVTYDAVLRDEHWEEIFVCSEDDKTILANQGINNNKGQTASIINSTSSTLTNQTLKQQNASKFMSFFHISDFIAILSGYKVAFVDPHERLSSPDERSYVAIFDLENDTQDIEQFEDQFKPLEKIFNIPLLKNRYYQGTIIRLPLRTQSNTCNVSSKLIYVKDILVNAKDFMKEAHLHVLFSKNISSIHFCRSKDGQNIEKIYSVTVEDNCLEQFKNKHKKINESILNGEFPSTSTIMVSIRKQIEAKTEKIDWILSTFADTMRLLNSNHFLMKIAIPISDNYDKDIRFSYKSNLISSDTGFLKTLHLTKPIICYIEDKEGILMSHFSRLNISDSLKLSHFNDAYALMLKDLTLITRKDPSLIWSLMPNIEKHQEFAELLAEIWIEIARHQLFYSRTEGWGYVGIEDMIINNAEDNSLLQNVLTYIYSSSNYPVVIMPEHAFKALQKYAPKESIQIMTPSQTSDILHNNINLIEQLKFTEKTDLLEYLLKEQQTRYILDLPLLLLANNKFIRFQSPLNSKVQIKDVYLVEKKYMKLFLNTDPAIQSLQLHQFISTDLSDNALQCLKLPEFQSKLFSISIPQ